MDDRCRSNGRWMILSSEDVTFDVCEDRVNSLRVNLEELAKIVTCDSPEKQPRM
jgi:intracellular sulfur oxidation DsrE/DsrF family protein